jgi:hypothetical protein
MFITIAGCGDYSGVKKGVGAVIGDEKMEAEDAARDALDKDRT